MTAAPTRSYALLAVAIIIAAVIVSASALSYSSLEATVTKTGTTTVFDTSTVISTSTMTQTLTSASGLTTTSSTCSGYPPAGDCPGTFSYTFTVSVNYTGPWAPTYEGCSGMSTCSPTPSWEASTEQGTTRN